MGAKDSRVDAYIAGAAELAPDRQSFSCLNTARDVFNLAAIAGVTWRYRTSESRRLNSVLTTA